MASFTQRMIGAAKLNVPIYEEVEADRSATMQALAVVVLSAVAAGVGALGDEGVKGPLGTAAAALVGWFLWAALVWLIGTKLLPEATTQADVGQLLRTIGFSASPGILRVLAFIPVVGSIIVFISSVWMLVAMIVGVRQALDYSGTGRAVAVCVIGFLVYLAFVAALYLTLGLGPAMTR